MFLNVGINFESKLRRFQRHWKHISQMTGHYLSISDMYLHMLSLRTSQIMFDSVKGAIMHCWKVLKGGNFFGFFLFMYDVQHIFICRPSDSTVPEDARIESA